MTVIEASIISLFEERLKLSRGSITKETRMSDLGIDSLMFMNVIVDIEDKLQSSLDDESIIRILTVQTLGELCDIFSA